MNITDAIKVLLILLPLVILFIFILNRQGIQAAAKASLFVAGVYVLIVSAYVLMGK